MAEDIGHVSILIQRYLRVGWSDDAYTGLILGRQTPARVAGTDRSSVSWWRGEPSLSPEPNYTARDLAGIRVPVTVAHSEHDEIHRARTR
jgi:hypothetical protein